MNNAANTVRRRDIDGIGKQRFHTIRFHAYKSEKDGDNIYLIPIINSRSPAEYGEEQKMTARDILYSLYNLYEEMNKPDCPFPVDEMIRDWCCEHTHPYNIHELYEEVKTLQGMHPKVIDYYGAFDTDHFLEDLGKLYQHFRFYMALEDLKRGNEYLAYNLNQPGRLSGGYSYFEIYKQKKTLPARAGTKPDEDRVQLLLEMRNNMTEAMQEKSRSGKYHLFERSPLQDLEELQDILIENFPDFTMNVCRVPGSKKIGFLAGTNSVFDIAWYAFARLVVMDDEDVDANSLARPRLCKACGRLMDIEGVRQQYCLDEECQRARKRKNRRDCDARKRINTGGMQNGRADD